MSANPVVPSSAAAKPTTPINPLAATLVPVGPDGTDPAIALPKILNYLRDNDRDRDPYWNVHFKAIETYVNAAQDERRQGCLGYGSPTVLAELDQALMMVDLHRKYEMWNYGPTPWSTHVLPPKDVSDRLIAYPKLHPRPPSNNDKSLWRNKRLDVPLPLSGPSPFYTTSPSLRDKTQNQSDDWFANKYRADELAFFDALDKHTIDKKKNPNPWTPPEDNLFKSANEMYEHCIERGIGETAFRYKLGPDPITGPPTYGAHARKIGHERGLKRAAIQQALNLFTNHENKSINTPWTRVIMPYEKVNLPAEVPFEPLVLPPDRVGDELKEPFPWVYWYDNYKSFLDHVAYRKRNEYLKGNWEDFDRSCVPINYHGPYIVGGNSVHDDYWLRAGKCLVELEHHLKDRYGMCPRPLLKAMLNDIEAGKKYPYQPEPGNQATFIEEMRRMDYYKRRDLYMREESGKEHGPGLPRYRLISEWEMTWLRFVGEPASSVRMMEKIPELRQDNLALIFENRLQEILRAPGSWESTTERAFAGETVPIPIDELLEKINGAESEMLDEDHLRQPNRAHQFTIEEAEHYIRVLARMGRCTFYEGDEESLTSVGPPPYDLFPEDRILWRHIDDGNFNIANKEGEMDFTVHLAAEYEHKRRSQEKADPQQYCGILDHRFPGDDDSLPRLIASKENEADPTNDPNLHSGDMLRTLMKDYWVPETHYVQGDPDKDENERNPVFDDLASWGTLSQWAKAGELQLTSEKTCQFLRSLAFRMGVSISYYDRVKARVNELPPITRDDIVREMDHWGSMVDSGEKFYVNSPDGTQKMEILDTPTPQGLVDKVDPQGAVIATMGPTEGKGVDPFVIVRKGLIDDCVQNRNMRYPGREAAFRDMSQNSFHGTQRPNLFSWATSAQRRYQAPYTRRTFFHMRRWPLHRQSQQRQEWYRSRLDEIPRIDPGLQKTGILTARIDPGSIVPRRKMAMPPMSPGEKPSSSSNAELERELASLLKSSSWIPPLNPSDQWDTYAEYREKYGTDEQDRRRRSRSGGRNKSKEPDTSANNNNNNNNSGNNGNSGNTGNSGNGGGGGGSSGASNQKDPKGGKNKIIPFTRPSHDWIPGPAIFPMGETMTQALTISDQLHNAIYPPGDVPWVERAIKKLYKYTHRPPARVPLLPEGGKANVIPSNPLKRRLPDDFIKNGPAKRPKKPVPDDGRPDSGKVLDPEKRVFRRPGRTRVRDIAVDKSRPQLLDQDFPNGWKRVPVPMPANGMPQIKGLERGVHAVTESLRLHHTDVDLPATGELEKLFNDVPRMHPHWTEVRKHKGLVDDSYAGPTFGDRMAAALYFYGLTTSNNLALGVIDTRFPNDPFVYPLPMGRNKDARIVWIYHDGQLSRLRPTPVARDYTWQLGDFDNWSAVDHKEVSTENDNDNVVELL